MSEDNGFSGILDDVDDLSNAATKFPVLEPGVKELTIVGFELKDGKTDGKNLNIILATTAPEKDINNDGAIIDSGHKLNLYLTRTTPSGGLTKEMIARTLAQVKEAALGHHNGKFDTEELVGKSVSVVIANEMYQDQPTNKVKRWIPKTV